MGFMTLQRSNKENNEYYLIIVQEEILRFVKIEVRTTKEKLINCS